MALVEKLKEIIGTVADGYHHALLHLAEVVESGAGGVDIEKLKADISASVREDLGPQIVRGFEELQAAALEHNQSLLPKFAELEAKLEQLAKAGVPHAPEVPEVPADDIGAQMAAAHGEGAQQGPEADPNKPGLNSNAGGEASPAAP